MSDVNSKKESFFSSCIIDFKAIFGDILFAYKHFFHWTISRALIFIWSIILGILISLPFVILTVVIAWIDPISWLAYFSAEASQDALIFQHVASHPYWLFLMFFLICSSTIIFLLASSYSLLLLARVSLKYTQRKLLDYKKNLYFSGKHVTTFMILFSWNLIYILAPIMIWCGGVFFLYLLYHSQQISFSNLSSFILVITLILIFFIAYIAYRILFGYILLAQEKDTKNIHKAKKYLQNSIKSTCTWKKTLKFFMLILLVGAFLSPFRSTESFFATKVSSMKDALAFKSKLLENIDAADMSYYKYITKEYESYSNQELIDSIVVFSRWKLLFFILNSLAFGGLIPLVLTSFYIRVLSQKN